MTRSAERRTRATASKTPLAARVAAVAVVAVACAGPKVPIEVGVKEFPINILLGGTEKPTVPKVLPNDIGFEDAIIPPPPREAPRPAATPPGPCPEFHPFAGPKVVATNKARNAPVEGTYAWRHTGSEGYPPTTTRKVTNINPNVLFGTDPAFTFDVVEDVAGQIQTSHYMSVPESSADQAPAGPKTAGLYLTGTETKLVDGTRKSFAPQTPLQLVQYPAGPGAKWRSVATDALSQTIVSVDAGTTDVTKVSDLGVETDKLKVNACGEPLDAWSVKAQIRTVTPTGDVTQDVTFGFALQYGGFTIFEIVKTYPSNDPSAAKDRTSIINQIPNKPPGAF